MEFSILNAVRNHPARPRDLSEVYAEFISDAVLAEELGFVAVVRRTFTCECQWTGSP